MIDINEDELIKELDALTIEDDEKGQIIILICTQYCFIMNSIDSFTLQVTLMLLKE